MAQIRELRAHFPVSILCWIVMWSLSISIGYGQLDRIQIEKRSGTTVSQAIVKLKLVRKSLLDVDLISQAGAAEAIPDLRIQFPRSQDQLAKARIAEALVRLGDKSSVYWKFSI